MSSRIKTTTKANRLPYPVIGHIRCGKKSDRGLPMSTDYFLADGKYASLFHKAYGEKPDVIQIVFPSDDAELVCKEEYEFRDTQGKRGRRNLQGMERKAEGIYNAFGYGISKPYGNG